MAPGSQPPKGRSIGDELASEKKSPDPNHPEGQGAYWVLGDPRSEQQAGLSQSSQYLGSCP